MISSMTAYARYEKNKENIKVFIETRTYNSRFLDIALKMPSDFAELEEGIKKKISKSISRSRVEIRIFVEDSNKKEAEYTIDHEKAKSYLDMFKAVQDDLGLNEEIRLEQLLKCEGVMKKNDKKDCSVYKPLIDEGLDELLSDLYKMRMREGESLYADLDSRLGFVAKTVDEIEIETNNQVSEYNEKLKTKIKDLVEGDLELDETRIAQEVAILVDKSDISEEIVRAKSHIKQFKDYMDSKEYAGRKLNFLLQEIHREINTIGVKSGNSTISKNCVEVKSELEKLREQVQNVE